MATDLKSTSAIPIYGGSHTHVLNGTVTDFFQSWYGYDTVSGLRKTVTISSGFISLPSGPGWSIPMSFPQTILAASAPLAIPVRFTATAVGGFNARVNFTGAFASSPNFCTAQLTVDPAGSVVYTVTPNPFNFGLVVPGTPTLGQTFTLTNTGLVNLTVNTITNFFPDFILTAIFPVLPATLSPGQTLTFSVACNATLLGAQNFFSAIRIVLASGPITDISLSYTGVVVIPAFTITGATRQILLSKYGTVGAGAPGPLTQILDPTNLSCESPAFATKQIDFADQSELTYFNRLFMRLERYGTVTITVQDVSEISENITPSSDTKATDATADQLLETIVFDMENNGEIHAFTISIAANGGPFSMTRYVLAFDPRGTIYEAS